MPILKQKYREFFKNMPKNGTPIEKLSTALSRDPFKKWLKLHKNIGCKCRTTSKNETQVLSEIVSELFYIRKLGLGDREMAVKIESLLCHKKKTSTKDIQIYLEFFLWMNIPKVQTRSTLSEAERIFIRDNDLFDRDFNRRNLNDINQCLDTKTIRTIYTVKLPKAVRYIKAVRNYFPYSNSLSKNEKQRNKYNPFELYRLTLRFWAYCFSNKKNIITIIKKITDLYKILDAAQKSKKTIYGIKDDSSIWEEVRNYNKYGIFSVMYSIKNRLPDNSTDFDTISKIMKAYARVNINDEEIISLLGPTERQLIINSIYYNGIAAPFLNKINSYDVDKNDRKQTLEKTLYVLKKYGLPYQKKHYNFNKAKYGNDIKDKITFDLKKIESKYYCKIDFDKITVNYKKPSTGESHNLYKIIITKEDFEKSGKSLYNYDRSTISRLDSKYFPNEIPPPPPPAETEN